MADIKLHGRVFITGRIQTKTGLHIGGSEEAISIGGVDNTVIRDPLTQRPYIPGSSLKGKMRSLLEKSDGRPQNRRIGQAHIHTCEKKEEYAECAVCQVYGVPGELDFAFPTRIVVRDVMLTDASADDLNARAKTVLPFTEVKTEVAIDRVTSAAVPRQLERVPAGVEFGDFEFVYSLYERQDTGFFRRLLESMSLLEDDYLGGSGTRGSGKIAFTNLAVSLKKSATYTSPDTLGEFANLDDLLAAQDGLVESLSGAFPPLVAA